MLSRLGAVASEYLLQAENDTRPHTAGHNPIRCHAHFQLYTIQVTKFFKMGLLGIYPENSSAQKPGQAWDGSAEPDSAAYLMRSQSGRRIPSSMLGWSDCTVNSKKTRKTQCPRGTRSHGVRAPPLVAADDGELQEKDNAPYVHHVFRPSLCFAPPRSARVVPTSLGPIHTDY